jgi:uncharacterized protein
MAQQYATPGVYIEEVTGPGVIAGVSTSTVAFIGPAIAGSINKPRRITSFDEFTRLYGTVKDKNPWPYLFSLEGKPYYMAFAVEGFFTNGGQQAYIVRVGTAAQASLTLPNRRQNAPEPVFTIRAIQDGEVGKKIQVEVQQSSEQKVTTARTDIHHVTGTTYTVEAPLEFAVGDFITTDGTHRAKITAIQGDKLITENKVGTAATSPPPNSLRIADILPDQMTFRVNSAAGLYNKGTVLISNSDGNNIARVRLDQIGLNTNIVTFAKVVALIEDLPEVEIPKTEIKVTDPGLFKAGDFVTTDGSNQSKIQSIQDKTVKLDLDQPLPVSATKNTLRLAYAPAPPPQSQTYSLDNTSPKVTSIRVVAGGKASVNHSKTATVEGVTVTTLDVNYPELFRPGDFVTCDGVHRAQIQQIRENTLTLDRVLGSLESGSTLRIADIIPEQMIFRVTDTTGLYPGTVVEMRNNNDATGEYVVIHSVNSAGFVTLEPLPARSATYRLDGTTGSEPILIPQEFRLIVTTSATGTPSSEYFDNLSLNPFHPRYVFNPGIVTSTLIELEKPDKPPICSVYPDQLITVRDPSPLTDGNDDSPSSLTASHYKAGLDALRDIDDVNILCIPDAAAHPDCKSIQSAMFTHCQLMKDRFAILDSCLGAPPSGDGSVEEHVGDVRADGGYAALYYPWLLIRDPTSTGFQSRKMLIPPSGHMAGVYAREDAERGVHKAPANTDVRGVLGLETRLSDRQQAPLNLKGVNVLRIFPGSGQVTVWGARTTVDPIITDWLYINVRRLMLYIEESIEEGIRWAVFEPNDLSLWKDLKRTITDFLRRVWQDGALFGQKEEQAFQVRINEALNPPSTRALGRLYIEIKVAPVRPAEFIIVRIGLWDGGSEVSES